MNGISTTFRRSASSELREFRNFLGVAMLISLAVVFFGAQLLMVGPLRGRLDGIQSRLELSETSMKKLVSARETVWKTNDLLTGLEDQAAHLDQLRNGIAEIQTLRNRVQNEGESATIALAALDRMSTVQNRIIAEQQTTQQAAQHLSSLHQLQRNVIRAAEQSEVASNSLEGLVALQNRVIAASNGYEQASAGIAGLTEMTNRLVAQSEDLQLASQRFDQFVGLLNTINAETVDVAAAQGAVTDLVALKDQVLSSADTTAAARQAATSLIAVSSELGSDQLRLEEARQNLDSLVRLQTQLSGQSADVVAAIQNLEIIDDFQREMAGQIKALDSLRRTMMEIAMMESTLGRVAQVIEPLSEIGNLRRLSEIEVREAARVILDQRMARFAQTESMTRVTAADAPAQTESAAESLVPLPVDPQ